MKLRTRVVDGRTILVPAVPAAVRPHPRGKAYQRRRLAVAGRDGWVCQLCGEPIDRTLHRPHPMALHVDHVVDLAASGTDSMSNLRATHARCNVSRDRPRSLPRLT